jgi:hypothetical protein
MVVKNRQEVGQDLACYSSLFLNRYPILKPNLLHGSDNLTWLPFHWVDGVSFPISS